MVCLVPLRRHQLLGSDGRHGDAERPARFLGPEAQLGARKILVEGYDNSVYSDGQNFRMVHQSKPGSGAVQTPVTLGDDPLRHTIQHAPGSDLESTVRIGSAQFPLDLAPQTRSKTKAKMKEKKETEGETESQEDNIILNVPCKS